MNSTYQSTTERLLAAINKAERQAIEERDDPRSLHGRRKRAKDTLRHCVADREIVEAYVKCCDLAPRTEWVAAQLAALLVCVRALARAYGVSADLTGQRLADEVEAR